MWENILVGVTINTDGVDAQVEQAAVWTPPEDVALTALLQREWGLDGWLSPLPSYSDHNRHVHTASGDYVLKLAHPRWALDDLDFENQALLHLQRSAADVRTPRLHVTRQGEAMLPITLPDGRVAHARVIDFVQGRLLADVAMGEALARSIGEQVAHLTRGLADFDHPAAHRAIDWNLMALLDLRDELPFIADAAIRQRVTAVLDDVEARLPEWKATLPQQVVHNDANDYNIIVDAQRDEVSAIIDFGDMCYSFRLSDLAVASVYAIQGQADPLHWVDVLREGYASVLPLTAGEREALPLLIRARLCLSILMATRAHRADPGNDYVLVSQRAVRDLLLRLS